MRIDELRSEVTHEGVRIACRILWQKRRCPPTTLWFDIDPAAVDSAASPNAAITPFANAFATGALPLAFMADEEVLEIDAPVCSRLTLGLEQFAQAMRRCFPRRKSIRIIADRITTAPAPEAGRAIFLSGGVDSLALLCHERLPGAAQSREPVSRGLHIFGLNTHDFAGGEPVPQRFDSYRRYLARLKTLGSGSGVQVVGMATNIRALFPDFEAWASFGWVPGTVAAAHACSGTIAEVTLASSNTAAPSHPADVQLHHLPLLSSGALSLDIGLPGMSRLDKTRLVAASPHALALLRSCLRIDLPTGAVDNCGTCEKCVRTMLALHALGKLEEAGTYPSHKLVPEIVGATSAWKPEIREYYAELLQPLAEAGRTDLVNAVSALLARSAVSRRGPTLLDRARSLLTRMLAQAR
jgi:hypothetical protein